MNTEDKVMGTLTIGMLVALFSVMGWGVINLYTYYQCQVGRCPAVEAQ